MKRTHDCRGPEWLQKLSVAIATRQRMETRSS